MRYKGTKKKVSGPISSSVCYCDGKRELGTVEVFCIGCRKWFHERCLRHFKEFNGISFMVCYTFYCEACSPTKVESWMPKKANLIHMCVTVLANLTFNERQRRMENNVENPSDGIFFNFEGEIIPYIISNWENLTSMTKKTKNTWHQTLSKSLTKEVDLFEISEDGLSFALKEKDLGAIGPALETLKLIGKSKPVIAAKSSKENLEKIDESTEGPKTRGYSKRKAVDTGTSSKKAKFTTDYSSTHIAGLSYPIDFPFNREGYRYYLVEKDLCAPHREVFEKEDIYGKPIPAHIYRVVIHPVVTLSPNDRAYQLKLSDDRLSVTGIEGYSMAKATHSVVYGTWYYEVSFVSQPPGSHIRIGWSQAVAPVQACVGYTQLSYAWRSHKGTVFHQAKGKHYMEEGFKEGDVLGCLISLPVCPANSEYNFKNTQELPPSSTYLPPSHKNLPLIHFKHHYFFEEKDDVPSVTKNLKVSPGSFIEFYRNGVSCGIAFKDLYCGFYFPAVSLFQSASIRCNFGPSFKFPLPEGAKPICERIESLNVEQTLSDIVYLVENEKRHAEEAMNYAS